MTDHPAPAEPAKIRTASFPSFLLDDVAETYGTAPKWRLSQAVEHFSDRLDQVESKLILRRGSAASELLALARETGAGGVCRTRAYDPDPIAREAKRWLTSPEFAEQREMICDLAGVSYLALQEHVRAHGLGRGLNLDDLSALEKDCEFCSDRFTGRNSRTKFCSPECRDAARDVKKRA